MVIITNDLTEVSLRQMQETFSDLIISHDNVQLGNFLNKFSNNIPPKTLNHWFQKAARYPGNWTKTTDRNTWLNQYYLRYVQKDIRGDIQLTNRHLFQRTITHQERLAERERLIAVLGLSVRGKNMQ